MQDNRHRANLTEFKLFVGQNLEATLRKSDAIHSALESGKPFLFAGLVFDSAKEVGKSLVNSVRNILFNLRMYVGMFASKMFVVVKLPQSLSRLFICLFGNVKKLIVDCLTIFERINNSGLLFSRRINPIPIHQQAHSQVIYEHIFKCCDSSQP